MNLPKIIQGGMGVAISDWKLAKSVAIEGQLGVVSGTGVAQILVSRLMDGDPGGHCRRALEQFPFQEPVNRILVDYYRDEQQIPKIPYKRPKMWAIKPPKSLVELTIIANFVEIYLAKEGHKNMVGINLLEKIQMPTMASIYGALLANVDVVIMGAGIPFQIPGLLDNLAKHKPVSYRLDVKGADRGDEYRTHFDPLSIFPEAEKIKGDLHRPLFFPIISSVVLGKALLKRASGEINGFIIEAPTAGGHNAPPRGVMKLDEKGEPIYGKKDEVDFSQIKELGLPFWLAGGWDTPAKLKEALDEGATGVQVGTAFSYCDESGLRDELKRRVIDKIINDKIVVRTDPLVSPTGFPFKVVQLEGTLSDYDLSGKRKRICDVGMLRHLYKQEDGKVVFRCSSEPIKPWIKKGGKIEETVGKSCLCNNLYSTAGFPQHRKDGYVEPPIITAGDGLVSIGRFFKNGKTSYTAKDVLKYLLN